MYIGMCTICVSLLFCFLSFLLLLSQGGVGAGPPRGGELGAAVRCLGGAGPTAGESTDTFPQFSLYTITVSALALSQFRVTCFFLHVLIGVSHLLH